MKPTHLTTFQLRLRLWLLAEIGSTMLLSICEYDLKFHFKRISTAWYALPAAVPSIPPRLSWLRDDSFGFQPQTLIPKLGGAWLWHQAGAQQLSYGFRDRTQPRSSLKTQPQWHFWQGCQSQPHPTYSPKSNWLFSQELSLAIASKTAASHALVISAGPPEDTFV